MLERELAEAVRANKASGGLIVVMEPSTGGDPRDDEPARPTPSPIRWSSGPGEEVLHKAVGVTNQYEPGSVMKLVTMASALELGLVTPSTMVNDTGIITFQNGRGKPPTTIKNWDLRANGTISDDRGAGAVVERRDVPRRAEAGTDRAVQVPRTCSGSGRRPASSCQARSPAPSARRMTRPGASSTWRPTHSARASR